MTRIARFLAFLALIGLAGPLPAQDAEDEDTIYPDDDSVPSVKCIRPKMIKGTQVIDDRNILFYMRGNKVYRNVLPRRCKLLLRNRTFSYNTTYGRLCDIDKITLLPSSNVGLNPGFRCDLGKFYPLTPEELEVLFREVATIEELGIETGSEADQP